ncbi:alpha/beta fold hydrolase [Ruania alba]|uniref:Pimeloyl-ACP methyl ester carboxylesterase n=1 Tax=Ruania alba TaxID=648782 RepID=A0A1H5MNU8_9MICO|nr:alpha/beta hydrolase [Ruania alba]SEE90986.1 Pimeloyl-ACP methyl ester carboxylesterase [Ruania alba]
MIVDPSIVLAGGPWAHRMVAANGGRFHLALAGPDDGEAPLVVLLHAFPQFWWAWRAQIPALAAAGYRVAAMDLRGYAGSDKPPSGHDTPSMVADVRGVIRSLGASSAVVIGHGLGGQVAWSMPAMAPEVTRAIAVLGAPHPVPLHTPSHQVTPASTLATLARFQVPWFPERSFTHSDGVARLLQAWGAPAWEPESVNLYTDAMRLPFVAHSAMEQLRWSLRSTPRVDGQRYRARVNTGIQVPVLSVRGSADPVFTGASFRRDGDYTHARYSRVTIDGAGHWLPEEAPEEVSELLIGWLDELE